MVCYVRDEGFRVYGNCKKKKGTFTNFDRTIHEQIFFFCSSSVSSRRYARHRSLVTRKLVLTEKKQIV